MRITNSDQTPETLLPGEKMEGDESRSSVWSSCRTCGSFSPRFGFWCAASIPGSVYNRAARIVEQLEAQGIVSAPGHNGNREVLAPAPQRLVPIELITIQSIRNQNMTNYVLTGLLMKKVFALLFSRLLQYLLLRKKSWSSRLSLNAGFSADFDKSSPAPDGDVVMEGEGTVGSHAKLIPLGNNFPQWNPIGIWRSKLVVLQSVHWASEHLLAEQATSQTPFVLLTP